MRRLILSLRYYYDLKRTRNNKAPRKLLSLLISRLEFGFYIATVVVLLVANSTYAQSGFSGRQEQLRQWGIDFYDPTCDGSYAGNAGTAGSAASGGVYVIGDSLTVGMRDSGKLEEKLQTKGYSVSGIQATTSITIDGSAVKIEEDRDKIENSDIVVVALGTNPGGSKPGNFGETIDNLIEKIKGIKPDISIRWMNIAEIGNVAGAEKNADINTKATEHGFQVINWALELNSNPDRYPLSGDNIHHTTEGYGARAQWLADNIGAAANAAASSSSGDSCTCAPGGSVASGAWAANVAEPWRSLILRTAPLYPDVDPRTVAAELWIENRGWPEYKKTGWAVSSASAQGPWQFIPSTWASIGGDYNNDGVADPNDPEDEVHAAFKHNAKSAGEPISPDGYDTSKSAEDNFETVKLIRSGNNLLHQLAKYNGRGAPNGGLLKDFSLRSENQKYVVMGYWLLATDFTKTITENGDGFRDVTPVVASDNNTDGSPGTYTPSCNSGSGAVNADGYSFPMAGTKSTIRSFTGLPCNAGAGGCHHDGTPAFDLFISGGEQATTGTPVYAIHDGIVKKFSDSYKGEQGCHHLQLQEIGAGDSEEGGWMYWYGHIQNSTVSEGQRVTAGQQIAVVGERRCTGNDSDPHLHIDRGSPQGEPGGYDDARDPGIIDLINTLYEMLPES